MTALMPEIYPSKDKPETNAEHEERVVASVVVGINLQCNHDYSKEEVFQVRKCCGKALVTWDNLS